MLSETFQESADSAKVGVQAGGCPAVTGRVLRGLRHSSCSTFKGPWLHMGREHSLVVLLQPGSAVGEETGVLGDQEVQQAVVVSLRV